MIKEARGFGDTIDEAKEQAITDLGAAEDADIQFEVIATPKKKTLGLFGGRKAEVRVFVEYPDPKPANPHKTSAKAPKKDNAQKNQAKKPKAPADNEKSPKAQTPKAQPPKAETQAQAPKSQTSILAEYGDPVDAADLAPDSKEGKAASYLRTILEKLGCTNISMKVASKENAALILLDGEGVNVVIGHRGETLDALQYLTSLAANRGGGYFKITINIGNYREKREETLTALANRVAAQVLRTGKSRSLEPMNPYERRIIHTAVQSIDGVYSSSYGEGSGRRVIITPDGQEPLPPKHDDRKRSNASRRRSSKPAAAAPAPNREPKKDSDTPLYGKIN